MKNLKRILSLALAGTMLVGMMVVGASAASFTDADSVEHTEAVETLNALGIIQGNAQPDGTTVFDPKGDLSRAQMAVMLSKIMSGGKDVATFIGKDKSSFTDAPAGQWYIPYIEYCANFGIVNGYSQKDGTKTFAPTASVTATEAARMILNAMGYKWDGTGNWELATEVQARELGLYAKLDEVVTNKAISRDNVAQMLFTALNADLPGNETYSYISNETRETGKYKIAAGTTAHSNDSIAGLIASTETYGSFMEAFAVAGAAGNTLVYGVDYKVVAVTASTQVTKTAKQTLGHKMLGLVKETGNLIRVADDTKGTYTVTIQYKQADGTYNTKAFAKVAEDCSNLMGQTVRVLSKESNGAVYGVAPVDSSKVVANGQKGDIVTNPYTGVKTLNGKKFDSAAQVYEYNDNTSAVAFTSISGSDACALKAIDNDNDGDIDVVVLTPFVLGTVNYLNSTTISVSAAGILSEARKNVTAYEDIAQGDSVIVIPATNTVDDTPVITKAETVSGTVTSVDAAGNVKIGGVTYPAGTTAMTAGTDLGAKRTLTLWNGYYVNQDVYTESSSSVDLVYVIQGANKAGSNLNNNGYEARVYFPGKAEPEVITTKALASGGKLYTYTVKDNVYTLTEVTQKPTGYEALVKGTAFVKATNVAAATVGGKRIADDATVIVLYKHATEANNGDANLENVSTGEDLTNVKNLTGFKILTGKDLQTWSKNWGNAAASIVLTKKVDGLEYATLAILAADAQKYPSASGEANIGYVVSDVTYENIDDTNYALYTIWNGTANVDVKDEAGTAAETNGVEWGAFITYDDKGNGIIETQANAAIDLKSGAITGYGAAIKTLEINHLDGTQNAAKAIDNDTRYFYIDSANGEGKATGTIRLADRNGAAYLPNVMFTDDGSTYTLVVVDVNNQLAGEAPVISGSQEIGKASTALKLADIKALPDGVYTPKAGTGTGKTEFAGNYGDFDKLLFVKFTGIGKLTTAPSYTLTIKNSTDQVAYTETFSLNDGAAHVLHIDTAAADGTGAAGTWSNGGLSAAGTYTFELTVGTNNTVILQGCFTR